MLSNTQAYCLKQSMIIFTHSNGMINRKKEEKIPKLFYFNNIRLFNIASIH